VFVNYFDDSIKEVDISQNSAIKACLQNGDGLADKVKAAYDKCFGKDFDFDDLAQEGGADADGDGLSDKFEGNEACFYKEMGWVDGSGTNTKADVIKADLEGLEPDRKKEFDENIDKCAAWNGSFGSRKKREAGVEADEVPAVMKTGTSALNWLGSTVRKTRSAQNGNGKGKGESKGKGKGQARKGKKSKGKQRKGKNAKKGSSGARNGKKSKGKGKTRKQGKQRKGKNAKKGRKSSKTGGKGKEKGKGKENDKNGDKKLKSKSRNVPKLLNMETYNKLWCFDLAMEQVLEKCVETKIKN